MPRLSWCHLEHQARNKGADNRLTQVRGVKIHVHAELRDAARSRVAIVHIILPTCKYRPSRNVNASVCICSSYMTHTFKYQSFGSQLWPRQTVFLESSRMRFPPKNCSPRLSRCWARFGHDGWNYTCVLQVLWSRTRIRAEVEEGQGRERSREIGVLNIRCTIASRNIMSDVTRTLTYTHMNMH